MAISIYEYARRLKRSIKDTFFKLKFKIFAKKAIRIFSELAENNNWEYFPTFGTLLGAYRENGFIKNDDDIDIAVNEKYMDCSIIRMLQSKGFKLKRIVCTEDKVHHHFSFYYKGITFDLYGYTAESGKSDVFSIAPIEGDWRESFIQNKYIVILVHFTIKGFTNGMLSGVKINIPTNSSELLRELYGEDFMTPIKGKKAYKSPIIEYIPLENLSAMNVTLESL